MLVRGNIGQAFMMVNEGCSLVPCLLLFDGPTVVNLTINMLPAQNTKNPKPHKVFAGSLLKSCGWSGSQSVFWAFLRPGLGLRVRGSGCFGGLGFRSLGFRVWG